MLPGKGFISSAWDLLVFTSQAELWIAKQSMPQRCSRGKLSNLSMPGKKKEEWFNRESTEFDISDHSSVLSHRLSASSGQI